MNGFRQAIDRIIDRVRPDAVLHSGDLFDHSHPTPHAIDFAMRQIRRLGEANIPLVVVEGDHSAPRIAGQGQVLRLLLHLPHIHVVCGDYAQVEIGDLAIHVVPHRAAARGFEFDPKHLDVRKANILLSHAVADGLPYYQTKRYAAPLAVRDVAGLFDYVALGHCHRYCQVKNTNRAFYSGTTAMVAQADFQPGSSFGFNVVKLGATVPVVSRELLSTRPMHSYGLHDARGLSSQDVLTFLQRQTEAVSPKDAYCQVNLDGLEPLARRELSVQEVSSLFQGHSSLQVHLHVRGLTQEEVTNTLQESSPVARFQRLAQGLEGTEQFKEEVRSHGISILREAQTLLNSEDTAGNE